MANVSSSNGLEKRPKLRFPGFDEPYILHRIGDIYAERSERGADDMELLSVTMNDGVMQRSEIEGKDNSSEDKSNYKVVRKGDMVYNSMRMWQGANGVSSYDGIVSPAYTVLTAKVSICNEYFAALFKNYKLINEFRKNSQGMTSDTWNLKYPQIETIKVYLPEVAEQEKVASMLVTLDKRIAAQVTLVEQLKKYKRGAISHILSGKDSEFAGEAIWAEKTLSDLCCEFRSGRNISATLIHESGDYPVYGGNGIRGYCDHYSHEGEYVVVGRQGALCGNVRLIRGQNYLSEHAIAVRANEENDTKFLLYLLDFMNLGQYSDQGAQPGLAVNKLLRLKCNVPEKKIQSKISAFLLTYDKQIAFQESILSLLTAQRKAFLQQLFI
ncbi:restriction endonuclease subunit S [Faecalimonas sp. LCP19S3_D12]